MTGREGSVRILFDLQASQTSQSARRGVGRYSEALFCGVKRQCGDREMIGLIANNLPNKPDLSSFPAHKTLHLPQPPAWPSGALWAGGEADILDGIAYNAFIAPWRLDVIHVSNVFEGFGERVMIPGLGQKAAGQIVSATLYDLIPLVFSDHYLADKNFKRWYLSRLAWLRKADLLLAISESTRQDAISLLGIEPWRVVNISGGITMTPQKADAVLGEEVRARFGLRRPFAMYTGGDDFRKNISGAIAGFAALPSNTRTSHQLAVICAISESSRQNYQKQAAQLGLASDEVIFTGYVSDDELAGLYREAEAFIFPSLYEGFGLPVLEAMANHLPVIGGNNSSVREIINRPEALFDAGNPEEIAAVLQKVLTDHDFARDLSEYGIKRAKDFSFEKSARISLEAIDEALGRIRRAGSNCAVQGWLPMKKLAYLSPLPPAASGIATYSAGILPFLARHFDIDVYIEGYESSDEWLNSSMRIFNADEFEDVAANYDAILYEFGNSHFHSHMFDLLERFPGVVTFHDSFLGDIAFYLGAVNKDSGPFVRQMLHSHGPRFRRRWLAPDRPDGYRVDIMTELPGTKRYLNAAVGAIAHSPYFIDVCRTSYPEGLRAPQRVVPQAMLPFPLVDESQRKAVLAKLGYPPDAFIVGTFGYITETKMPQVLLEAFLNSFLAEKENAFLIFAGGTFEGPFSDKIKKDIAANNLNNRIRLTGFLPDEGFAEILQVCDVAVQLRCLSRGETSKGVLDAMGSGTAVIINDYASYKDYADDVAVKLSPTPDSEELARALEALYNDPASVGRYKNAAYKQVLARHAPASCAAGYAAAIYEFYDRYHRESAEVQRRFMAPHLAGCDNEAEARRVADKWLAAIPKPSFDRPRLIMDVSYTRLTDHGAGIARTTKRIIKGAYMSDRVEFEPVAAVLSGDRLVCPQNWLQAELGCLTPEEIQPEGLEPEIEFAPGDILLMLDSSWYMYDQFIPVFERARQAGTEIVIVVYDILPLIQPENFPADGVPNFRKWFEQAITYGDRLMCISETTMEAARDWVVRNRPERAEALKFGYWHLAADGQVEPRQSARLKKLKKGPFFLMVGTIEPRKNHELIFEAIKILRSKGTNINLCIAGKKGWMVESFFKKIDTCKKKDVFVDFIEAPDDRELAWLYTQAKALVYPSKGEGFGLPPIEAAYYGTPVICSDIPVLHEVCGSYATYIRIDAISNTAADLAQWLHNDSHGLTPDSSQMPRLTWAQSVDQLVETLFQKRGRSSGAIPLEVPKY